MHQILTNLYLGDQQDAQQARGMIHPSLVVNCSKDIPVYDPNTTSLRIPVNDDLQMESMEIMYSSIFTICAAIHASLQRNQNVLVHCFAGRQRSACVVAAYLMLYHNMAKDVAKQYIRSKRPVAFFPNANFEPVLTTLEQRHLKRV